MSEVAMKIRQGAAVVNSAEVVHASDTVVLIEIDTSTKRVQCAGTSYSEYDGPGILLDINEESLYEHETCTGWTEIEFSQYKGWSVFSCSGGKYTVRVTLLKQD